ncbi:MAG: hypothetical protein HC811_11495 [Flammeovirgaceae bacterium]|nr:hypothetical protein [Flammeovirgaceae bacterium]
MPSHKKYWIAGLSVGLYIFIGYFVQRSESVVLILSYTVLFLFYIVSLKESKKNSDYLFWIIAAFAFRFCFLFSEPQLSDDYFRYIWDGRMWANGLNAFSKIPSEVVTMGIPGLDQDLFSSLNSKDYITVYPILAQSVFWLAAIISPDSLLGSVVIIRGLVLLAEVGSLFLIQSLLQSFNIKKSNIFIYALNPLVVLELVGNLHFEVFVIFFLLLSIYFINRMKLTTAAVSFGVAVAAKLLPLILLPSLLQPLGWKGAIRFYVTVSITVATLLVGMLYGELVEGITSSIQLYFQKFEFNASVYYLVREYGFYTKGFNIIQTTGWKLGLAGGLLILVVSFWKKRNDSNTLIGWLQTMLWVYGIYFLFATTVHPWYIIPMVALCVFTSYRFILLWSYLIFLTYTGYSESGFHENLWIVAFEYVVVTGFLVYEIWRNESRKIYLSEN